MSIKTVHQRYKVVDSPIHTKNLSIRWLRQKNNEYKASLGYTKRSFLKITK